MGFPKYPEELISSASDHLPKDFRMGEKKFMPALDFYGQI